MTNKLTIQQLVTRDDEILDYYIKAHLASLEQRSVIAIEEEFIAKSLLFYNRNILTYARRRNKLDPTQTEFSVDSDSVKKLHDQMVALSKEVKPDLELNRMIQLLKETIIIDQQMQEKIIKNEKKGRVLKRLSIKKDKQMKQKSRKKKAKVVRTSGSMLLGKAKDGTQEDVKWFLLGDTRLKLPKSLYLCSSEFNVIADSELTDVRVNEILTRTNVQNNDFTLVLVGMDSMKASVRGADGRVVHHNLTVKKAEIMKAREQRLTAALGAGSRKVAASLIVRGLKLTEKDTEGFSYDSLIEKYKEEFLCSADYDIILRDVYRMLQTQFQ